MADFDPDSLLTSPHPDRASMPIRRPLTRDQAATLVRKYNPDITNAAVQGEVDNIVRESGGDFSNRTGDGGTSGGLYQHHNERLTGLKGFAAKHGVDWTDPEIQVQYSRLEKERDYPSLLRLQQTNNDQATQEDSFKRIFERPASVLWGNDARGRAVPGSSGYRFSDYAKSEHDPNDLYMMEPQEYLDLTPQMTGQPFQNPSGRSLMKSFNRGEPIESIPSLNVDVNGPTATVTDQDGRHRALLAQQEGVPAIPVAIKKTGEGDPKEIVGMQGKMMAHDFPHYQEPQPQPPKAPISLMGQIGQAIMPSAEAAQSDDGVTEEAPPWAVQSKNPPDDGVSEEPPPWAMEQKQGPPGTEAPDPNWSPDRQAQWMKDQQGNFSNAMYQGISKGVGNTMFGGEELLGKGMEAVGVPGGQAITSDARARMAAEQAKITPVASASPSGAGIGEFVGGMIAPGGVGAGLARNALARGAISGATAGMLQPGNPQNYWGSKALQAGAGAGAGALTGMAGNALTGIASGSLDPAKRLLVSEGVQLTPGQLQGGSAKRAEDTMASWPVIGGLIRAAQRRSFETFNQAAINRALDDIGQRLPQGIVSGFNAISHARDMFRNAYNSVIPNMSAKIDTDFQKGLNGIYLKAQQNNLGQRYLDELQHVIKREIGDPFKLGYGNIDGASFQKIGSQLDMIINRWKQSEDTYYRDMAGYLREADNHLDDMMRRQNPQLQAAKDKIDEGYSKFKTVEHATGKPGSLHEDSGTDGTFTPAQLARSVATRDRSKDKAAYHRGDAMMQDLSRAAQVVLPHKVPDSGTPERLALMGLLTGGLHFEPHTALGAAALAAPYTAPASRAMNWATNRLSQMAGPRQQAIQGVGNVLGSLGAVAAGTGAAGAVDPQRTPQ